MFLSILDAPKKGDILRSDGQEKLYDGMELNIFWFVSYYFFCINHSMLNKYLDYLYNYNRKIKQLPLSK